MSSFINMMGNDIWTEADITRHTESMIRTEFSLEAETILNRKVLGMAMGYYRPTLEEQMEIGQYQMIAQKAQMAGTAAREDMTLLLKVLTFENAKRRLLQPPPPEDALPEHIETDITERAEAQAIIDGVDAETINLFNLRNPPEPTNENVE